MAATFPRKKYRWRCAPATRARFRQEYEASFETFTGRVVYAFARAESVKPCAYDPAQPIHIGMDFNINPMSATCWQEDGEITRQFDEIILPSSNTDEMAAEIIRRYARQLPAGFDGVAKPSVSHITIYPDPAGAAKRFERAGQGPTSVSSSPTASNVVAMSLCAARARQDQRPEQQV